MKKTNAARILERKKISYRLLNYSASGKDLGAETAAREIGLPVKMVFKTLVARGDKSGVIIASLPGDRELDLKALAALSGNKKVELVPLKEVQRLTGYLRGAVSPLGLKSAYPYYLDRAAFDNNEIVVSAGARGFQLALDPTDLVSATGAGTGSFSR